LIIPVTFIRMKRSRWAFLLLAATAVLFGQRANASRTPLSDIRAAITQPRQLTAPAAAAEMPADAWLVESITPLCHTDDGQPIVLISLLIPTAHLAEHTPALTRAGPYAAPKTHTRVFYIGQPPLGLTPSINWNLPNVEPTVNVRVSPMDDYQGDHVTWGSIKQDLKFVIQGEYYQGKPTADGVAGSILVGISGLDAPADVRDLIHNVTHWKWSWGHAGNTLLNGIGLIPVVGVVKNFKHLENLKHIDNVGSLKHLDNGTDLLKQTGKEIDELRALVDADPDRAYFAIREMIRKGDLDFSTAENGAVFWSGKRMTDAQEWALRNGKTTLEQTPGGQVLNELDLFGKNGFDNARAAKLWNMASGRFSSEASGVANVFSTGASRFGPFGERTWWRIEKGALMRNSKVSSIYRRRLDGTMSQVGHINK
jgi:hypothetical protein